MTLKLVTVDGDKSMGWNCAERVVSLCWCLLDVPWNVRQSHYRGGCTSNLFWDGKKEMGVIKAVNSSTELTNTLLISHDQRITLDHFKFGCRNLKSSQSSYTENPLVSVCMRLKTFDPTFNTKNEYISKQRNENTF